MKIFSGTTSQKLTDRVCLSLSDKMQISLLPGNLKIEKFSDGEILPIFGESLRDEQVFFIQSTNS